MPVIVVTSRDNVETHVLEEGKPLFLGRAPECNIVLPSSAVSRRHAVILYKNGICGVKDLGSFNGTILNDAAIQEPHRLTDKDILRISSYIIRLHTKDPSLEVEETGGENEDGAGGEPKPIRIDSGKFEDSGLHLPRAMHRQQEAARGTQRFVSKSQDKAELPGHGTDKLPKVTELADDEIVPAQAGQDASDYFTPFPIPKARHSATQASEPEPSAHPDSISDFEESPLAQLENIGTFDDTEPTPFLASSENFNAMSEFVAALSSEAESVIPLTSDYASELANLSSHAEAVIPLLDDTPLVSTLTEETAQEETDAEGETEDPEAYESVPTAPDTAVYTLPAGIHEPDGIPDTGRYLVESPSVLVPTESTTLAKDEGRVDTGESEMVTDTDEYLLDEFGGQPTPLLGSNRAIANIGKVGSNKTSLKGKSSLAGIASITISSSLMEAINTRLSLYSLLYDLVEERRRYREENPILPEEVEEELKRQDRELDDLPTAEEADKQLQDLNERNALLEQAIQQAEEVGVPGPARPSPESLFAEDLAVTQWILISDSNRQALPAVYREAYPLAMEEPLVKELISAGISHGRLMGGALYLLALESLATMANKERFRIARKIRKLQEPDDEDEGFFGKLGKLGKKAENFMNRSQIREQILRLENEDRVSAIRVQLAKRESAFMEKTLAREFRQVYKKVALRYIPDFDKIPHPIRAFLRHGVIGYSLWWMTREVREYIVRDCTDNLLPEFTLGTGDINVLYADEYLHAVSQMDCSPSPDEDLMASSLNSTEWKTDRAYRRIVNARSYDVLMEEMINQLDLTSKYLNNEAMTLDRRIATMKAGGFSGGNQGFELQTQRQQFQTRWENINRNIERIKEELIPSILEAIEEAERRFRTGDLRIPDQETLIRREVNALFRIGRRLEGERERFMPMIVREHYRSKADLVNDRAGIRSIVVKMEELDPGIFMRTIIPAKQKRNRVNLRMTPTVLIFPSAGKNCYCSMGREGMESGHLVVPTCFVKPNLRTRKITHLLADFRWETSRLEAGRELAKANTLAGVFTKIRKAAAQKPKEVNEKHLLFLDKNEKENWRKVYEVYLPDALNGGRLLFQRNPELYEGIIGKYIDTPEGVKILRRG